MQEGSVPEKPVPPSDWTQEDLPGQQNLERLRIQITYGKLMEIYWRQGGHPDPRWFTYQGKTREFIEHILDRLASRLGYETGDLI